MPFSSISDRLAQPKFAAGVAALFLVLLVLLIWTGWRWGVAEARRELLEARAAEGFLLPPSSTRSVRVDLREPRPVAVDTGGLPKRVEFAIAVRTGRYDAFRLELSRDDGTSIVRTERLARDSNSEIHFAFNTTMLADGRYRIAIGGYPRRGPPEPVGTVRFELRGR